jgi:hypothetical protein
MFFHGHMSFPQIFEEKVKTIVLGHLHPSVRLSDKVNIKREKYKCFLTGKYNGKEIIIVPSFLGIVEGTAVNDEDYQNEEFSIIPYDSIKSFDIHAIADDGEIFEFGKVRRLS